ncbi:helix-turn-helix transcriptional regulator [bacterium]|nr:helix-turn-helix transcriptional regulator [bacterium]
MDKAQLLKRFGKNVKIERVKNDFTQGQLAEIMGVSQNYVACIETGKENMSLGKILDLSKFLNTDISNLLNFMDR